jgi:integrase/recombinase XerD
VRNANVNISLDTRREKSDHTYPIILRLSFQERNTSIPTGVSVALKDWDDEEKIIKRTYRGTESHVRLNNYIQKLKTQALDTILKLQEAGKLNSLSVTAIRDRISKQDSKNSFFSYAEQQVQDLINSHRIGTARSYKGIIAILKTYTKGRDLKFTDIGYSFLSGFELQHRSKGGGLNGLSVYLRAIRAIYNKAIKEGIVEKEMYPFNDYKIKSAPTAKRALEWTSLQKIIDIEIASTDKLFNARNYFLASYMMYGMNFTDMAYLKKTDIQHGRIQYRRKKTAKIYDIKISDSLAVLFSQYNTDTDYVFPILKTDTPITQAKEIQWARKRYNAKLKLLAKKCELPETLTSYVSRHSFATQAMLKAIPLNAISSMLGHSSIKTTEIYLKSLPSNILDDYNDQITSMVS